MAFEAMCVEKCTDECKNWFSCETSTSEIYNREELLEKLATELMSHHPESDEFDYDRQRFM